ncbi:MAG: hypothetical protein HDS73_03940 [Bacteroidales bacterium]|nr:hypothetical protein [Bacteroidales bacterium]
MTVYETLKICGGLIESLEKAGIRPSDHKYVGLCDEYREARKRGEKVAYIVACLSAQYNVSERSVYEIVKRLGSNCKSVSAVSPE